MLNFSKGDIQNIDIKKEIIKYFNDNNIRCN